MEMDTRKLHKYTYQGDAQAQTYHFMEVLKTTKKLYDKAAYQMRCSFKGNLDHIHSNKSAELELQALLASSISEQYVSEQHLPSKTYHIFCYFFLVSFRIP